MGFNSAFKGLNTKTPIDKMSAVAQLVEEFPRCLCNLRYCWIFSAHAISPCVFEIHLNVILSYIASFFSVWGILVVFLKYYEIHKFTVKHNFIVFLISNFGQTISRNFYFILFYSKPIHALFLKHIHIHIQNSKLLKMFVKHIINP